MRERSTPKQIQGDMAEQSVCEFLEKQQLRRVTQNYRCRVGEIDLIMRDSDTLVFVEVRYRTNPAYGSALESVTYAKQQRLIRAAQYYLQQKRLTEKVRCRFDVVVVQPDSPIEWIKNAFDA